MIDYTNLIVGIRLLYAVVIPLLRFQDGPAEVHTCLISRKTHLSARTEGNSGGFALGGQSRVVFFIRRLVDYDYTIQGLLVFQEGNSGREAWQY